MKRQRQTPSGKNPSDRVEPTPYELARLATALSQEAALERVAYALSQGPGNYSWERDLPEAALKGALALWLKADDLLQKWRASPATVFPEPAPQSPPEPEPKKYPARMDEFLRLAVPTLTGRTAEQGDVLRRYLRYRLRDPSPPPMVWDTEHTPKNPTPFDCCDPHVVTAGCDDLTGIAIVAPPIEPTKDDVDRYFALWNSKGIPNPKSFQYHKRYFREWYDRTHLAESSAARRENALKRHARAKLRKHLWEASCNGDPNNQVPLTEFPEVTDQQMARLLELNKGRQLEDYKNWNYKIDGSP